MRVSFWKLASLMLTTADKEFPCVCIHLFRWPYVRVHTHVCCMCIYLYMYTCMYVGTYIFWLVQSLQYLLFVLRYSVYLRTIAVESDCLIWITVVSITSFGILDKLLHVSYFQFPHLKNGDDDDDDDDIKLRVIKRSKSVIFPSQLILFLTHSKHSITISYHNYLLSPIPYRCQNCPHE